MLNLSISSFHVSRQDRQHSLANGQLFVPQCSILRIMVFALKVFIIVLGLFLDPRGATASDLQRYYISSNFIAPAPAPYLPVGDAAASNGANVKVYSYTDETNFIFYVASYALHESKFSSSDVFDILKRHAQEMTAIYKNPTLRFLGQMQVSGNSALVFSTNYELPAYPGIQWNKFGVAIFKENKIYRWVVSGANDYSKKNIQQVFYEGLPLIEIN